MKRILSTLFLILASCGQPKAASFKLGTPVFEPQFQQPEGFNLTVSGLDKRYSGQFVLWDPNMSADSFQHLLEASHTFNELSLQQQRFYASDVIPARHALKNAIEARDSLTQKRTTVVAERRSRVEPETRENAKHWFENSLNAIEGLSDADKTQARAVFKKYCEAKIWELAVDADFIRSVYKERPTPSGLCEGVYEESDFFNDDSCKSESQGKSYFNCFWTTAVSQTSFVSDFYGQQRRDLYLAKAKDIESELTETSTFGNKILYGARYANNTELDQFLVLRANTGLVNSSPNQIISAVETSDTFLNSPARRRLAELLRVIRIANDAPDKNGAYASGAAITHDIEHFATRSFSGASANEIIFNFPRSTPVKSTPGDFSTAGLPDIIPVINESTPELDNQIAEAENEVSKADTTYKSKLSLVSKLQGSDADRCATTSDTLSCSFHEKVRAVHAEHLALAMTLMSVETRTTKTQLVVTMKLEDVAGKFAQGCASLTDGSPAICEESTLSDTPLVVHFDPLTRKLSLSFALHEVEKWGLGGESTEAKFCHIESSKDAKDSCAVLEGKTFSAELYPSSLGDGLMPFLSGKVSILDSSGSMMFSGAASFLFDTATPDKQD